MLQIIIEKTDNWGFKFGKNKTHLGPFLILRGANRREYQESKRLGTFQGIDYYEHRVDKKELTFFNIEVEDVFIIHYKNNFRNKKVLRFSRNRRDFIDDRGRPMTECEMCRAAINTHKRLIEAVNKEDNPVDYPINQN